MKKLSLLLTVILIVSLLAGCVGTPVVYYTDCTCEQNNSSAGNGSSAGSSSASGNGSSAGSSSGSTSDPLPKGAVKTGLAIVGNAADSKNAEAVSYDVTVVAVTVDDEGIIRSCIIDSVGAKVSIDASGAVTSDVTAAPATKNELGENYGMKAYGGAKYEWFEQAAALAQFAVGKTVDELRNGAVDESGKAPAGTDLASTATIYLGGYVSAIEAAVANAQNLGAQAGDILKLAVNNSLSSSKSASADGAGLAQLDCDAVALTEKDGVITSCYIDSLQAKVNFDMTGTITTDLSAPMQTKNQLGANYGMVAWAGAVAEWNEQAASFAEYVTGKTAAEVAGIAVSETTVPTEADLTSCVTIAIGGFQNLIAKAMQ